jgi:hypothetical protein
MLSDALRGRGKMPPERNSIRKTVATLLEIA